MNNEQINKYFRRIGLNYDISSFKPDLNSLNKIQYAHVTSVPYENIDILNNIPLNFNIESLYEKIILKNRGGYCFEINCLYSDLLKSLGYNTKNYMARYLRNETAIPMRRHRVMVVKLPEGEFLCDAGIGDRAARIPVLLSDTPQDQYGETYKIIKEPFFGNVLYDLYKGEWKRHFSFTEEEQLDIDYIMPSFYCEKHPDSPFNKSYIVSIKTENGRMTLDGMTAKIFDNKTVISETIENEDGIKKILSERFNINY